MTIEQANQLQAIYDKINKFKSFTLLSSIQHFTQSTIRLECNVNETFDYALVIFTYSNNHGGSVNTVCSTGEQSERLGYIVSSNFANITTETYVDLIYFNENTSHKITATLSHSGSSIYGGGIILIGC